MATCDDVDPRHRPHQRQDALVVHRLALQPVGGLLGDEDRREHAGPGPEQYRQAQAFVFDLGYSGYVLAQAAGASHYAIRAGGGPGAGPGTGSGEIATAFQPAIRTVSDGAMPGVGAG